MKQFDASLLKNLYRPDPQSHKGQNGKLLIIGGSKLFHSASIWAAEVASRIVDMVFYSSIDENNEIVKGKFQNGIVVPRNKLPHYIDEADVILIGPGLPREEGLEEGDDDTKDLTENLLKNYPDKKWVIDGGSLQVIKPDILPKNSIVTPHHQEFRVLFGMEGTAETAMEMAKKYGVTILLKGQKDIVCD
ncbi:MAG: NAD(P)H-hydrate dehydratase, partial [Patescibacteria group bacterium]